MWSLQDNKKQKMNSKLKKYIFGGTSKENKHEFIYDRSCIKYDIIICYRIPGSLYIFCPVDITQLSQAEAIASRWIHITVHSYNRTCGWNLKCLPNLNIHLKVSYGAPVFWSWTVEKAPLVTHKKHSCQMLKLPEASTDLDDWRWVAGMKFHWQQALKIHVILLSWTPFNYRNMTSAFETTSTFINFIVELQHPLSLKFLLIFYSKICSLLFKLLKSRFRIVNVSSNTVHF